MRFGLLGPLTAQDAAGPLVIGSAKVRLLLGILLLKRGQVVSSDELKAALWGTDLPATASSSLHNHVTRLRRALGPEGAGRLRSVPPGYLLDVDRGALDSDRHEDLLAAARSARLREDWETVRRACATALGLWRGSPLADLPGLGDDLPYGPGLQALDEARLVALEWRCEADLRLGRYDGLAAELYALTEQHPLREGFHRHLMVALHRTDRQAEALAVFHRLRKILADELGVSPGRAVQEALTDILRGHTEIPRRTPASPPGAAPAPGNGPATPAGPHIPAQLPPVSRYFSGRRTALARLDGLLEDARGHAGTGPIVISGPGGVGKTTLAVHWAHRVRAEFPDGQLHLNLRGFAPDGSAVTPDSALRGLLEGLGVPHARVPASREARTALYRTLTDGRRYLILLDNARDAEHVRPLLTGSATSLTVVTSRDQLLGLVAVEDAQPVALDVLSRDEARELLTARVGRARVTADPRAVDEVVELTARLPLALAVVGARAAVTPALGMTRLVERLRRARGLDAFTGSDARSDVRAVLSWSYETLSTDAARLFRLLAVHPGPGITAAVAGSLSALPASRVHALLTELAEANLVAEGEDGRYAFHDLLRAYAVELGEQADPGTSRGTALRRVTEHYLHTAQRGALLMDPQLAPVDPPLAAAGRGVRPERLADVGEAREWFTGEHAALVETVVRAGAAGLDLECWQLAYVLKTYLNWGGHWADAAAVQTAALEAAERMDDPAARARAHRSLAAALRWGSRDAEAGAHLDRALELFTAEGNLLGQADVHLDLAGRHEQQDRPEEALHHNERALGLFREAGHRSGEAKALNNVGYFHALLGDHAEALAMCDAARRVFEELGDRRSLALTWDSLGVVHQETGDLERAAHCFRLAAEGLREVGSPYHEAVSLDHLGDAESAAGRPERAGEAWQRAWELLDGLRHDDAEAVRLKLRR
ncbi:SARP family transcriptional regulator [Streptomyces litmocidini]|uniref:AfsR/SARP family transcriptional regulator n=1 Tax=Streptomyces litmocidini TaxID=67318 RepID=UPI00167CB067|nr:BTAD domain-containing putative transcriptional regulator [Streptomyces litmocidini]GGU81803.1 SARP family transcriptional regulator [Streptomyces litmocidini]